ncbi:MAG TPA: hypothetical protein VII56_19360 [Rhizomicrobium sp.]
MRSAALLAAVLACAAPAAAADLPATTTSTYSIVRARFVPQETLVTPDGPDPYIGVKVRGAVQIRRVLSGKPEHKAFSAELWLPKMSGPLDVYLLLETEPEGAPQIAAWSLARSGFCIDPETALDGPTEDIIRLRKEYPCKRRSQ